MRSIGQRLTADTSTKDLVACVQRAYRPFVVTVTDIDPGSLPHLEHVIAGLPGQIGHDSGTVPSVAQGEHR